MDPTPIVDGYLAEVDAELTRVGVGAAERAELTSELRRHIEDARAELAVEESEAGLRNLLERLGRPDVLAAEAALDTPAAAAIADAATAPAGRRRVRRWQLEAAGAVVAVAALVAVSLAGFSSSRTQTEVAIGGPLAACAAQVVAGPNGVVRNGAGGAAIFREGVRVVSPAEAKVQAVPVPKAQRVTANQTFVKGGPRLQVVLPGRGVARAGGLAAVPGGLCNGPFTVVFPHKALVVRPKG